MAENWKGIDDTAIEQKKEELRQKRLDKRELKRILLGHSHQNEEGRLTADSGVVAVNRFGLEDGAIQIYFLGIMFRRKRYETRLRKQDFAEAADKAMSNIGRRVILEQTPDMPAVFRRYKLLVPSMLFLEFEDGAVTVICASAKALTGFHSMRKLQKAFEKEMGSSMSPAGKDDKK